MVQVLLPLTCPAMLQQCLESCTIIVSLYPFLGSSVEVKSIAAALNGIIWSEFAAVHICVGEFEELFAYVWA